MTDNIINLPDAPRQDDKIVEKSNEYVYEGFKIKILKLRYTIWEWHVSGNDGDLISMGWTRQGETAAMAYARAIAEQGSRIEILR